MAASALLRPPNITALHHYGKKDNETRRSTISADWFHLMELIKGWTEAYERVLKVEESEETQTSALQSSDIIFNEGPNDLPWWPRQESPAAIQKEYC